MFKLWKRSAIEARVWFFAHYADYDFDIVPLSILMVADIVEPNRIHSGQRTAHSTIRNFDIIPIVVKWTDKHEFELERERVRFAIRLHL